jgi:hypothetical protein
MLIKGSAIGRPEYECVLLGDSAFKITQTTSAGQLTSAEVHELWSDFLHATEGSRRTKNNLMGRVVKWFGPRW